MVLSMDQNVLVQGIIYFFETYVLFYSLIVNISLFLLRMNLMEFYANTSLWNADI